MTPIKAPILPAQQGAIIANLQQILQNFVNRQVITLSNETWEKMLPGFREEQEKQYYGNETAALVVQFRLQHKLGDNRDIDEATAAAINALLEVPGTQRTIRGVVSSANGRPAFDVLVKAFKRNLRSLEFLGETHTAKDGQYAISFSSDENTAILTAVFENEKELIRSPNNFSREAILVIDLVLPDPAIQRTEFENLALVLQSLPNDITIDQLTTDDIDVLAGQYNLPAENILLFQQAFIAGNNETRIPAAVFYAWFKRSLSIHMPVEELIIAVAKAVKDRLIPRQELEKLKTDLAQIALEMQLAPAENSIPSIGDLLNTIPEKLPFDRQLLVAGVLNDKNDPAIPLTEKLKNAGLEDDYIRAVDRTMAFRSLAGDFLPLIGSLQKETAINSIRDLALQFNKESLTQKIIKDGAHPADQNPEDFAGQLYNKIYLAEPTATLRNMLGDGNNTPVEDETTRTGVARFLSNIPGTFNIRTTSVYEAFKYGNAFNDIDPELLDKVRSAIKSLQRVAAISPVPEVLPVLMKTNLTTSLQISDMPEHLFVENYADRFGANGEAIARQLHRNAVDNRIRNEQGLMYLKEVKQGTGIAFIDKSMRNGFDKENVFDETLQKNNLSWDLLFGDTNLCECSECTSVYSAAAYFVDLLQYLRNNAPDPKNISGTPLQKLFDRRPDLKCLQLTCKNTNTLLPYVDLVNEVMENYIAFQKTLPFNVSEDETSGELLAQPQHIEYKAYDILHEAVYPFTLPYHQPVDAARIRLNFLETSRYELIDTFRSSRDTQYILEPMAKKNDPLLPLQSPAQNLDELYKIYLDTAADAEFLGLTQEEFVILTKEAFVSKKYWDMQSFANGQYQIHTVDEYRGKIGVRPVHEYYGYTDEASLLSSDEALRLGCTFVKDQFIKRTGLTYIELVELLKSQCVNPNMPQQQALNIMNRIQFSYRFLQSLVIPGTQVPEQKYALVTTMVALITSPLVMDSVNKQLGLDDPCQLTPPVAALTKEDITQWVYDHFERIGKIIVLDNGVKCINGKIYLRRDNLVDLGVRIENCKIIKEDNGEVIGSVDKVTGLVTLNAGQQGGDWSTIIFIGTKGEKGTFVVTGGKAYLIMSLAIDTCNLDPVRLIHLDGSPLTVEEYDRIHRFIRLWRKLGWSIDETDNAVMGLKTTQDFDLTPRLLHQLAMVKKLYEKTGLELNRLLCFWTNIGTAGERSLYRRLFLTHNLQGIDTVFHEDEYGRYLANNTQQIAAHLPVIMASLNLSAEDIEAIMKKENIDTLTLENVSVLYRYRLLSKWLGLHVTQFIDLLPMFDNPFDDADATVLFLQQWEQIEDAGFTAAQLNYIIRDTDDPRKPLAPEKRTMLLLAKKLYDGLNEIEQAHQDLPSGAMVTTEMVKEKAALLYDQAAIENIMGILEGSTTYTAVAPKNIIDLQRPNEVLQFDNYPLLKTKVKYDSVQGALQIKGRLTEREIKGDWSFLTGDLINFPSLLTALKNGTTPLSAYLWNGLPAATQTILNSTTATVLQQQQALVQELNASIAAGNSLYDVNRFNGITLPALTTALMAQNPAGDELVRLNRLLLEAAYPQNIRKNQRIGLSTVLNNLQPALAMDSAYENIRNQQEKSIADLFKGTFSATETAFLNEADENGLPENNTAPIKRLKFQQLFLPYLRKELTYRFITDTLAMQTGLANSTTGLLLTKILRTGNPAVSLYSLLQNLHKPNIAAGWDGYLLPAAAAQYTFIIKDANTQPVLKIDGIAINCTAQPGSPTEWWSDPQPLPAGKLIALSLPAITIDKLYWKSATSAIDTIPLNALLPAPVVENTAKAFVPLQKAALLINGLIVSDDEIQYLTGHAADFDNLDLDALTLQQFLRLASYVRFRNSLPAGKIGILEFFNWTAGGAAADLSEKIEALTGWKKEYTAQLIQANHFNLLQPALFNNEKNLLKLKKAFEIAGRINVALDTIFTWAKPNAGFETCNEQAGSMQHAIRARYNQDDWEELVKPLNDKLRENQKNASIAYLLVQKKIIDWGVTDADGLFEFFLIDVQMDACMETSRIKQAISSVQLFIQRCFLGLEEEQRHSGIKPNVLDRGRWEWMQRYRVWEANRKIFLYPENWIESNLRDDKSIFFRELESDLLQKDINKQNIEDALKAYLYKIDEVANMQIVGMYVEKEKYLENGQQYERGKKLHVFARTRNAPYVFYYRYLNIMEGNWYPWEKIQVDIPSYDMEDLVQVNRSLVYTYTLNPNYKRVIGNGCFLVPVVWNGRLLIFFPQFMRKTKPGTELGESKSIREMAEGSTSNSGAIEYWEIKMAWSEYRNGKWTQKQVSTDVINDVPPLTAIRDTARFWKAFNDDHNARARRDAAYIEKVNAEKKYQDERQKFLSQVQAKEPYMVIGLNTPVADPDNNGATPYTIGATGRRGDGTTYGITKLVNASHPLVTAYEKSREANTNALEAAFVANDTAVVLNNTPAPPDAADLARYIFIPLISVNGDFAGIRVDYARDVNAHDQKGIFEFNGSRITAQSTAVYSYTRGSQVYSFNHYASTIVSLQENDNRSYLFTDGFNTTFTPASSGIAPTINFYHQDIQKLLGIVNTQQLGSFFRFPLDGANRNTDKDDVFGGYDNDTNTATPNIYHELKRPYAIYNWELFFHIPLMLANAFSNAQQFEDAMKWYHYVFNPMADGTEDNRFWQFIPFKDTDAKNILDKIMSKLSLNKTDKDIDEWRNNPFKPHLVARSRPVAYMKWVVMKYVDNLVAWGDYLFRQDTIESINQATQLYILASHILGPRPQMIPKRGKIKPQTYLSLLDKWDAFSNAMVELEMTMPFSNQIPVAIGSANGVTGLANIFGFSSARYFCLPNNPKLMGYWDTIADRLFKIRHCENIAGIVRRLPLFEPPIDPALLVKAAAEGISISSVINDLNTPMPNYRFYYLMQKALELCSELKSMGSALLSAIEKKDNEAIALLRAHHESGMQNLVMEVKKQQLAEAQTSLEVLQQNRKTAEHRMKYYLQLVGEDIGKIPGTDSAFNEIANAIETPVNDSGMKLMVYEKQDLDQAHAAADWQTGIGIAETLAGILNIIPVFAADVKPFGVGAGGSFGGTNLGSAASAIARGMQTYSSYLSFQSSNAAKKSGFIRALQDRLMQANAAGYEIKQIDKQILAQQIRIGIANLEITNQQKQIDDTKEIETFLQDKYTNEELYAWMKGNLSALYRQVYNLAFDLSKKAEKVYCFERGLTRSDFIKTGYWDAGYNGLLSGEQLYVGLKQLEAAYQENRGYDFEITRHVSIRQINPLAILQLKQTGACEFILPEELFDMDYPGHFKRRIKSVSVSVPCIAGPYTSLGATLRLLENKFRNSAIAQNAAGYKEKTDETDERFQRFIIPVTAIAVSSGQNDSGMFELNFKDERYLPFEGAGAISRWRLELPALRQFDYNTISDIVVHLRYTATDGGERLKKAALDNVYNFIKSNEELAQEQGLFTIIDLRHDLSTEWYKATTIANANGEYIMDLGRLPQFIPFYLNANGTSLRATDVIITTNLEVAAESFNLKQTPFTGGAGDVKTGDLFMYKLTGQSFTTSGWALTLPENAKDAKHMYMVVRMTSS